jgi:hypothetical protein
MWKFYKEILFDNFRLDCFIRSEKCLYIKWAGQFSWVGSALGCGLVGQWFESGEGMKGALPLSYSLFELQSWKIVKLRFGTWNTTLLGPWSECLCKSVFMSQIWNGSPALDELLYQKSCITVTLSSLKKCWSRVVKCDPGWM